MLTSGTVLPAPRRLRAATGPQYLKRQPALGDPTGLVQLVVCSLKLRGCPYPHP